MLNALLLLSLLLKQLLESDFQVVLEFLFVVLLLVLREGDVIRLELLLALHLRVHRRFNEPPVVLVVLSVLLNDSMLVVEPSLLRLI